MNAIVTDRPQGRGEMVAATARAPYNADMRAPLTPLLRHLLPAVALCVTWSAWAQAGSTPVTPAESTPLPADQAKAMEHITHEDALSRIDEVRVGGQTRSIDVKPKNGAPGYEITPQSGADKSGESQGTTGRSRWRILSF